MTNTTSHTDADATHLRHHLADQLREHGHVADERIDAAFRTVPRHLFVPDTPLGEAYANSAIYTKYADRGRRAISAASQPGIVAMQLAQLAVEPGQHVLELGTGTGYNAALLAHLVGPTGHVTTLDIDDDLIESARNHLAAAGIANVTALCQDGAMGEPSMAPYDRIIATVSTPELPAAWRDQLAPAGRLVLPLRLAGSVTRSVAFERDNDDRWRSVDSELCAFIGLRDSAANDPRRDIDLTGDGQVHLHAYQEQAIDDEALRGVLSTTPHTVWSGVTFPAGSPVDPMWLWLACDLPNAATRMETEPSAREEGLVTPMFRWGSMATTDGATLAYLTLRPTDDGADEVGVIGHGPARHNLVDRMVKAVRDWSAYRTAPITVAFDPHSSTGRDPVSAGQFRIPRSTGDVTMTWSEDRH